MFDENNDRRLVQVASIANAIAAAGNTYPWQALAWLADQAESGVLAPRLYIPARTRKVDTNSAPPAESLQVWRSMAERAKERNGDLLDRNYLPAAASTWCVHVNDLLGLIEAASPPDAIRTRLGELAQRFRGPAAVSVTPEKPAGPATVAPATQAAPAPVAQPDAHAGTSGVPGQAEPDPVRRLRALRALEGSMRWIKGKWEIIGIGELELQERTEGRPRSSQKTIRADLKQAAEDERTVIKAGQPPASWPP